MLTRRFWIALLAMACVSLGTVQAQVYDDQVYDDRWDNNIAQDATELSDIEWDPEHGYHEEEWYDPSDWFDTDYGIEYEDYGPWGRDEYGYDDDTYDYDYGYDYDDNFGTTYGYYDGWTDDDFTDYDTFDYDVDYDYFDTQQQQLLRQQRQQRQQNQQQTLTGRVTGLREVVGAGNGEPDQVVLQMRTQDGRNVNIALGDVAYAQTYLPQLHQGDEVAIGGRYVTQNGRRVLKAEEVRAKDSAYTIPEYEYRRTIRGTLTGLQRVTLQDGNTQALVARVRDQQGNTVNVLLGDEQRLNQQGQTLRRNSRIRIDGFSRIIDGRSTFVVQNLNVLNQGQQGQQQQMQQRWNQQRQQQMQQRWNQQRQQQMQQRQDQQRRQQLQQRRNQPRTGVQQIDANRLNKSQSNNY